MLPFPARHTVALPPSLLVQYRLPVEAIKLLAVLWATLRACTGVEGSSASLIVSILALSTLPRSACFAVEQATIAGTATRAIPETRTGNLGLVFIADLLEQRVAPT